MRVPKARKQRTMEEFFGNFRNWNTTGYWAWSRIELVSLYEDTYKVIKREVYVKWTVSKVLRITPPDRAAGAALARAHWVETLRSRLTLEETLRRVGLDQVEFPKKFNQVGWLAKDI